MAGNIKPSSNNMWQVNPEEGLNDPVTPDPELPYARSIPLVSGAYYTGPLLTAPGANTATNNTCYYSPFYVSATTVFETMFFTTSTSFSGTATVRLGIYNFNTTTAQPSTVLLDAGTISATTVGTAYQITINQSLSPGWYWLAFVTQGAATTNSFRAYPVLSTYIPTRLNSITGFSVTNGWSETGISGPFATANPANLTSVNNPVIVGLKVA